MRLNSLLPSASVVVALSSLSIGPATADRPTTVERAGHGRLSVTAHRIGPHIYETLVVKTGRRLYRVPDERVRFRDANGGWAYFNDDEDALYDHEFHFSPDGRYLFVTRKCMHLDGVGYLYHCVDGRGVSAVRPYGLRFDEAALRFAARRRRFAIPSLADGARVIYLDGWAAHGNRLLFHIDGAERWDELRQGESFSASYDLKSRRFRLLRFSHAQQG